MINIKTNQKGFTIVELLVATAVFSVILLGASVTIIEISKMYYKGVILAKTQTAARNTLESISKPIQLESSKVVSPAGDRTAAAGFKYRVLCVGEDRYTYAVGLMTEPSVAYDAAELKIRHAMWKDKVDVPTRCSDPANDVDLSNGSLAGGQDMLGDKMRLQDFKVDPVLGKPDLWSIKVAVLYGERDLMSLNANSLPENCLGQVAGSQWCALVSYDTMVFKRIKDKI